jgi:hypothetical protein
MEAGTTTNILISIASTLKKIAARGEFVAFMNFKVQKLGSFVNKCKVIYFATLI